MNNLPLTKRIDRWINKYLRKPAFGGNAPGEFKSPIDILCGKKYYSKIAHLIPDLASYKKETLVYIEKQAYASGYCNLKQYYQALKKDPDLRASLSQRLTLTGSHFFRGDDWEHFTEKCLSSFKGAERVNIWCAGCSSGQEVYSVLMALSDYVPADKITVLATDYNDEMVMKTSAGKYYNMHLHEVPEKYRKYVVEGEKQFTFRPEILKAVRTGKLNLLTDSYPSGFDVILCRNVMKFFATDLIPEVQKKLAASLDPGGYLFVGNSDGNKRVEMISDPAALGLEQAGDMCIYRKLSRSSS